MLLLLEGDKEAFADVFGVSRQYFGVFFWLLEVVVETRVQHRSINFYNWTRFGNLGTEW